MRQAATRAFSRFRGIGGLWKPSQASLSSYQDNAVAISNAILLARPLAASFSSSSPRPARRLMTRRRSYVPVPRGTVLAVLSSQRPYLQKKHPYQGCGMSSGRAAFAALPRLAIPAGVNLVVIFRWCSLPVALNLVSALWGLECVPAGRDNWPAGCRSVVALFICFPPCPESFISLLSCCARSGLVRDQRRVRRCVSRRNPTMRSVKGQGKSKVPGG